MPLCETLSCHYTGKDNDLKKGIEGQLESLLDCCASLTDHQVHRCFNLLDERGHSRGFPGFLPPKS